MSLPFLLLALDPMLERQQRKQHRREKNEVSNLFFSFCLNQSLKTIHMNFMQSIVKENLFSLRQQQNRMGIF